MSRLVIAIDGLSKATDTAGAINAGLIAVVALVLAASAGLGPKAAS